MKINWIYFFILVDKIIYISHTDTKIPFGHVSGEKGFAYTLVTDKDKDFAGHLVRNLESAGQHVPHALLELAEKVGHHNRLNHCHWKKKENTHTQIIIIHCNTVELL